MTTTVANMEETIELLHREAPEVKIIVGGAVLTPEYAEQIGADFYAKDAAATARIVHHEQGVMPAARRRGCAQGRCQPHAPLRMRAMGEAWPRRGNNARKQDHASPVFAKLLSKDRFFADSLSTLPTQRQETPAHEGA